MLKAAGARADSALSQGRNANAAILAHMSTRLKRVLAAFLAGAILLAGSGFSGAFAAGIEHGLGVESQLVSPPSEGGETAKKCDHGCAGHFGAHLVSLIESQPPFLPAAATDRQSGAPVFRAVSARLDSFFRPPRISLA